MPQRRSASLPLNRLKTLPKSDGQTFEGDLAPSGMYVEEGDGAAEAWVVMWVEAESGLVLSTNILSKDDASTRGPEVMLDAFVDACFNELKGVREAVLPAAVTVRDPDLWLGIRKPLGDLGMRVELVSELPALDEVLTSMQQHFGATPGAPPPEPFSWPLDNEVLRPLYAAAASYARRRPWEWLDDYPPIAVVLGKNGPRSGANTLYACILGSAGLVEGIAFYDTRAGFRRTVNSGTQVEIPQDEIDGLVEELRASGAPVDAIPAEGLRDMLAGMLAQADVLTEQNATMEDSMVAYLDPEEENERSYLTWLRERGLSISSRSAIPRFFRVRANGKVSNLSVRESRAMTLALEAVNGFLSAFRRRMNAGNDEIEELEVHVPVGEEKQMVRVFWPGDDW